MVPAPNPDTIQLEALRLRDYPSYLERVLGALRTHQNLPDAAHAIGIGLATLKRRMRDDKGLAAAIRKADLELRGPGERTTYNVSAKRKAAGQIVDPSLQSGSR